MVEQAARAPSGPVAAAPVMFVTAMVAVAKLVAKIAVLE
jgi:hypothetical protein